MATTIAAPASIVAPSPVGVSPFASRSVVALLQEEDSVIRSHALKKLNELVDLHWTEVAECISTLETLYEDETFADRELAALIASKVFFHLGELGDALSFALGAGALFDVNQHSEYTDAMISKAIDEYIAVRTQASSSATLSNELQPALETLVNKMFARCFASHKYKQALGIALECQRLDMVERAVSESGHVTDMLHYCFRVCTKHVHNPTFRHNVINALVKLTKQQQQQDTSDDRTTHSHFLAMCLSVVNNPTEVAVMLKELVTDTNVANGVLAALQVAFDLVEYAPQEFLLAVINDLPSSAQPATAPATAEATTAEATTAEGAAADKDVVMGDDAPKQSGLVVSETANPEHAKVFDKIRSILSGHVTVGYHIDFLHRHCSSDMQILKNIKMCVEARSSALYTALVGCNAMMHAGTTNDTFLRMNMDWLRQARNWAKFSVIGSLGVIRQGQHKDGIVLLKDFLPASALANTGTAPAAPSEGGKYQEGGALFALGLINANHGSHVVGILSDCLRQSGGGTGNDVLQHGAGLGLGLAALATANIEVYEDLKNVLFTDNTVAGEAAAYAMGLVMCGSGNATAIDEMLQYAHETQKEKIIRALSIGMALVMYGKERLADPLIKTMLADKDHLIRYGGMFLVGMAYAATADNDAIRTLLHVAVSDVSDDVRRAAVLNLGFVLVSEHSECPKVVSLLAESYNPHLRYGAAMAIGISCAGTAHSEGITQLLAMSRDPVDFVRQAAYISLSMLLVQTSELQNNASKEVREQLLKAVQDKHEETLAKIGAIMGLGIIDAGGRNATISLCSPTGFPKMGCVVGMCMFLQFWYWFPMMCFLGLTIQPTAVLAVNSNLDIIKMSMTSNARAKMFAYPPAVTPAQTQTAKKTQKAVLSTTKKQMAKEKGKESNTTDTATAAAPSKEDNTTNTDKDKEQTAQDMQTEEEALVQTLQNPARVTPAQRKYISYDTNQRYSPLTPSKVWGVVVVRDTQPENEQDIITVSLKPTVAVPAKEEDEVEPECPQPFRWP